MQKPLLTKLEQNTAHNLTLELKIFDLLLQRSNFIFQLRHPRVGHRRWGLLLLPSANAENNKHQKAGSEIENLWSFASLMSSLQVVRFPSAFLLKLDDCRVELTS